MTRSAFVFASFALAFCGLAQTAPISAPPLPAHLPGKGLAQHDFMYTGESRDRRIFIVRHGEIVWTYDDPAGKGEISDAVMLSNGNILFAHQFGVGIITPDKKIVWNYDAPAGKEIHTAVPIGSDHVLFVINGDPAVARVVNIVTGVTEREMVLPTRHPVSVHGQFRHLRLTPNGTMVIANMQLNKVVEYDFDGNELWSFPCDSPWGVTPLPNGNFLITDRIGVPWRCRVDIRSVRCPRLQVLDLPTSLAAAERRYHRQQLGERVEHKTGRTHGHSAGAGVDACEGSGVGTRILDSARKSRSTYNPSVSR